MPRPKPGPQSSAAMVPLQIVRAGGVGVSFEEWCQKVFQQFDPPIKVGTYSSVSSERQAINRELGKDSPYQNNQSEHLIANSAFQSDRGNNASNIPGARGYSEGGAFAYSVYDDQSAGTEHKFLTDAARNYEKGLTGNPTLRERLDAAKAWTKDMLLREDLQRTEAGTKRSRVSDKPRRRSKVQREALAEAASECLAKMAERRFAEQGVEAETSTRRGMTAPRNKPKPRLPKPRSRA